MRVHVAGQHHRVAHPGVDPRLHDPVARCRISVPAVHRDGVLGRGGAVAPPEACCPSTSQVWSRPRTAPPATPPAPPGQGPLGRGCGRRPVVVAVAARLVVAVLPRVEHVEARELAPLRRAVELHVRPGRHGRTPQRRILVVGAERGGRRSRNPGCEAGSSSTSSAQLFSTSWSSKTTSQGAAAWAACRSGSVLYWAWRWRYPPARRHGLQDLAGRGRCRRGSPATYSYW